MKPIAGCFLSTLALCLVGAVMVFSASAVTAREQYGNGYYFLRAPACCGWCWALAGMFALMQRRLPHACASRASSSRCFSSVLLMLVGVFFLDKSHATHRWIRLGPASLQPSELAKLAVILYLAWFLELRRPPATASA